MISVADLSKNKKKKKETLAELLERSKPDYSIVTEDYLNSFLNEYQKFVSSAQSKYNSIGYANLSSVSDSVSSESSALRAKAGNIKAYLNYNRDNLDDEWYNKWMSLLDSVEKDQNSISLAFHNAKGNIADLNNSRWAKKYRTNAYNGIKDAISSLETKLKYANVHGMLPAEQVELQAELDWLKKYQITTPDSVDKIADEVNKKSKSTEISALEQEKKKLGEELEQYKHHRKGVGFQKKQEIQDKIDEVNKKIEEQNAAIAQEKSNLRNAVAFHSQNWTSQDVEKYLNAFGSNEIAYTTSDGKNVTWQSLYDNKKKGEEIDSLYSELSSRPDWQVKSKFVSKAKPVDQRLNLEDFGEDIYLEYIHGDDELRTGITDTRYGKAVIDGNSTGRREDYDLSKYGYNSLNDKEKEIATYLYYTDKDAYSKFMSENSDYFKSKSEEIELQRLFDFASGFATEYPWYSSLVSVPFNVLSAKEYLVDTISSAFTGDVDVNKHAFVSSTIRSTVSENVNWEIGNWDAFDFVYNTGMSFADSMASQAIFGKFGGIALGLSAAAQGTNDALNKGMDNGQAFLNGFFNGVFEGVFESLSIGAFDAFKPTAVKGVKSYAKNLGKAMLVNGSEETFTELANIAYDVIANGDFSQYETDIRTLMDHEGLTEAEAKSAVAKKYAQQVAEAAASGALMGFGSGTISNAIGGYKYNKAAKAEGQRVLSEGGVDALKAFANQVAGVTEGSASNELKKLAEQVTAEQTRKNTKNVGKLSMEVEAARVKQNEADIVNALVAKGMSKKAAQKAASIINQNFATKEFSQEQWDTMMKDKRTFEVLSELSNNETSSVNVRNAQHQFGRKGIRVDAEGNVNTEDLAEFVAKKTEENSNAGISTEMSDNSFDVSEDGKNFDNKTGKILDSLQFVDDNGTVKVKVDDETTVDAGSVSYKNEGLAAVVSTFVDMGIDAASVQGIVEMFDGVTEKDAKAFVSAVKIAFVSGQMHFGKSDLSKLVGKFGITAKQAEDAYRLGEISAQAKIDKDQAKVDTLVSEAEATAERDEDGNIKAKHEKGEIIFEGEISEAKMQEKLRSVSIDGLKVLAELSPVRFHIFESTKDADGTYSFVMKNGKKMTASGWYAVGTRDIWIDINAGDNFEGTMLWTAAHEISHYIKAWNAKDWKVLADFLISEYERHNKPVKSMIEDEIRKIRNGQAAEEKAAKAAGKEFKPMTEQEIYDAAFEEVVCEAMVQMFDDGTIVQSMAKLKQEKSNIWKKFKEAIKKILKKWGLVLDAYKDRSLHTREARAVAQMQDSFKKFQELYMKAFEGANYAASMVGTIDNSKSRKEQARQNTHLLSMDEISDIQSIGMKSITQFNSSDIQKTTKLANIYWKEMKEKSPFFRAWFGEWRVADKTPVVTVTNKGATRGVKRNADTGWDINVSAKVFNENKVHNSFANREARPYMAYLDNIIENAVLLDTHGANPKSPNTLLMHSLYAVADIGKGQEVLKLYVEEMNSPGSETTGKRAYNLQNIEKAFGTSKRVQGNTFSSSANVPNAISSIADLVAAVKVYDNNFRPNPVSKVVNKDGTPRIVYHYTDSEFWKFDTAKSGSNQGQTHGDGIYISTSPDAFNYAGKNRMELYANIRNPFEMQLTDEQATYVLEKYAATKHDLDQFHGLYRNHAIEKLTSPERVFDYLSQYADENGIKVSDILKDLGYDGVHDGGEWVAFDAMQLKSATDNIGTFDGTNPDIRYQERDYPIDAEVEKTVKGAFTNQKGSMHELSKITSDQNKAINRLGNQTNDDSYKGKYEGGRHLFSDNAVKHIMNEHGDFLREALRAQLPMRVEDIARHLSAIKSNKQPSSIKPTRTKEGLPSILTSYMVNGYTLYAEEITRPLGKNLPSDLIGHTMYKAPTLPTAAFNTTSVQTQPKRQSIVLCDYYMPNSTNLSTANFVADVNGMPALLNYISVNGTAKQAVRLSGLIALSSDDANFTDKSGVVKQGYVRCKQPFYITHDKRVFSNSDTNVAAKIEELKNKGYDCFIFDKVVGDNYMVAVINKSQIIEAEPKIVTQERNTDPNRYLLASALESATKNDIRYQARRKVTVDKARGFDDNISRANEEGDFLNEFHDALSAQEWNRFYVGLKNEGKLEQTKIGTPAFIQVGNKLVIAERMHIGKKDAHDYVVTSVYEIVNDDISNSVTETLKQEMEDVGHYGSATVNQAVIRINRLFGQESILRVYERASRSFTDDLSKGGNWRGSSGTDRNSEAESSGSGLSLRDRSSVQTSQRGTVKTQERNTDSNRYLLASALESAAKNDIELKYLKEYKDSAAQIDALETRLQEVNAKIRELSFSKGKRDMDEIRKLRDEATKTVNRISNYDKKLLRLEANEALKKLLGRERAKAYAKAKQESREAFREYREKTNERIDKIVGNYQGSRKKAVEGRRKTELRNKIKKVVKRLNYILSNETKERNIKIGLRETVYHALSYAELMFSDDISNEDIIRSGVITSTEQESKLLNEYSDLLSKRSDYQERFDLLVAANSNPDQVDDLEKMIHACDRKIEKLNKSLAEVFERERKRHNEAPISIALESLADAYKELESSKDSYIKGVYQEAVYIRLKSLKKTVGGTIIRDMNQAQLQEVYDAFKMVHYMVTSSNRIFREGRSENLDELVSLVQKQIRAIYSGEKDLTLAADKVAKFIRSFSWNELKPYYAFERLGSDAFTELFWDVIEGEATYARDSVEAGAFIEDARKKYGFSKWDMQKAKTYKTVNGLDFKLTLADRMSIYAYSKRDQAYDHMTIGGFTFDTGHTYKEEKNGKTLVHREMSDTFVLNDAIIKQIVRELTDEQRDYVDVVQNYLTALGKKGNEVSRVLYGIDLFLEKIYFPLQSESDYRNSTEQALNDAETMVSLKNIGVSKPTVPHADNPIVLRGFDDVVLEHIDTMAKYHAFVLPIENLQRVFDNVGKDGDGKPISTKALISEVFGQSAKNYFKQFITDLNGGTSGGGVRNPLAKMFSISKGVSVSANLSVVMQQYFAIIRAMDELDSKYFVPILNGAASKSEKKQWEELKKYAPVAVIKEMGGFDIGSSRTMQDYIGLKKAHKDGKYVWKKFQEATMWAAGKMDELGWITIWRAVKKEIAHTTDLQIGTEEFLQTCGKRFTEIVVKTQVYDSVTSRSAFMRSKRDSVKYLTAFKGEPTTLVNMMFSSQLKLHRAIKSKDKSKIIAASKKMARTSKVLILSAIMTSFAKSFVYGGRDDDEDEALLERWMKQFGMALRDDMNPLNLIPVGSDLVSIWEGWDVERPDLTLIADAITSFKKMFADDVTTEDAFNLAGAIANIFGIPLKNVVRDAESIVRVIGDITDDVHPTDVGGAFGRGFKDEEQSETDSLYYAIVNGDFGRLEVIKAQYKTERDYKMALRQALIDNDPRIQEAVMAEFEGNPTRRQELVREIKGEGYFEFDIVQGAVNNASQSLKTQSEKAKTAQAKGDTKTHDDIVKELLEKYPKDFVEKVLGETIVEPEEMETSDELREYDVEDYYNVIVKGDTSQSSIIYDELISYELDKGYLQHEAESNVASQLTTRVKNEYMDGNITSSKAVELMAEYGGKTEDEAEIEVMKCDFELEHGLAWSERARGYRLGKISESDLISAVMDIEGEEMEAAQDYIRFLDLEIDNPTIDITADDASKYFEYAEPYGIDIEDYLDFKAQTSGLTGDKDKNGKTISGSKKAKVLAVINSLPISSKQKDALYYAAGYKQSTLHEAPWH